MDACAFDNERLVRPEPFELRFYPAFDYKQVSCTLKEYKELNNGQLPPQKAKLVERVRVSIIEDGLRNPLIVEWFTQDHRYPLRWLTTIGNNRYVALESLNVKVVPALIIHPKHIITPELSGDYEALDFMAALSLFDAAYPWWNSKQMCRFCPGLAPRCA